MSNFISKLWRTSRKGHGLGRELALVLLGALAGVVVLPLVIWAGGHLVLGAYVRDASTGETGGPLALWIDYFKALAEGSPGYWLACAGPYAIVQILRLARAVLRV